MNQTNNTGGINNNKLYKPSENYIIGTLVRMFNEFPQTMTLEVNQVQETMRIEMRKLHAKMKSLVSDPQDVSQSELQLRKRLKVSKIRLVNF